MAEDRNESIRQLLADYFLRLSGAPAYVGVKVHNPAAVPSSNLMTALGFVYDATGAVDLALIGTISPGARST